MRRSKVEGILYIYDILLNGGTVKKNEVALKFNVSDKTISRYINDIRTYIANERKQWDIVYSRKKGGYVLNRDKDKFLTKEDVLAIIKVLLGTRGFNKNEIEDLVEKLLELCVYEDRFYLKNTIGNELYNYSSPKHNEELINKIWDITYSIDHHNKLQIEYSKLGQDGKLVKSLGKKVLYPQGLLFSEYYFYLIAYIEGKDYKDPTIFRLDRINKYKILSDRFRVEYKNRFEEGQFRDRIQFMQSGKIENIKFRFTGDSIEAVLDRLPNAKVVEENKGEYIINATTHKKGIIMWLLSQGRAIEVLSPNELREDIIEIIEGMLKKYA
ncbi:helix-turn-helix transcriptional regulator [Dethiothermospora halolimnae]|uniref:helix-turn-helix transcriptional regulator n=1 Tax=Dethiothermospora halolimnae TaxID=3114390 RepID=UPI003CCB7AE0